MLQLLKIRNKIKSVRTIHRITETMRLASMSIYTRLEREYFGHFGFQDYLRSILIHLKQAKASEFSEKKMEKKRKLIIIASASKGLCGTYHEALCTFLDGALEKKSDIFDYDFITFGIYAHQYADKALLLSNDNHLIAAHDDFSTTHLKSSCEWLFNFLFSEGEIYEHVEFFSNRSMSFFNHRPTQSTIKPFDSIFTERETIRSDHKERIEHTSPTPDDFYIYEQNRETIYTSLFHQYLYNHIYGLLLEVQMTEQAARFLSMERATKNAEGLLKELILQRNKVRQASITREVSELIAGM